MITGFNTNVSHRGLGFHVQTEDSGASNPRVFTHLYHGGTVLASEKTDYADRLGSPCLEQEVRSLMEAQHKSILERLRAGVFDAVIAQRLGAVAAAAGFVDPASTSPSELEGTEPPGAPAPEPTASSASDPIPTASPAPTPSATLVPGAAPANGPASPAAPAAEPPAVAVTAPDPDPAPALAPAPPAADRVFGEGIVSDKPLDEVILEYLVEKARRSARDRARRTEE